MLPQQFEHRDRRFDTQAFLEQTDTTALYVVHDGRMRYERYWRTGGPAVAWLTQSVSKSVVGTGVALTIQDGFIRSLDDPISDYVPVLGRGGYRGIPIRDVLQMSSGIRWNEDYGDRDSDLNQFGRVLFTGKSYDAFVADRVSERASGTRHNYTGMDAQALTMLVRAVSGRSLADYLSDRLWEPLGMEDRAYWTTDDTGVELGLGGLCASARDLAKLGELYRLNGIWHGRRLLSADWVRAATRANAPHLRRGKRDESSYSMGYGYQWWLPEGDPQDYSAIGIYNQFIYVNPEAGLVVVKLSAHRDYANPAVAEPYLELQTFSLFRSIAEQVIAGCPPISAD
ncbi:MAG: serine hydrolase [Pseudomonadota bacterium]